MGVLTELPDASRLQELERASRQGGSGLSQDDLLGLWRVERLWAKGGFHPSPIAGAALRALQASLSMEAGEAGSLRLINAVSLGALNLTFQGGARLTGRRPLLMLAHDSLHLRLAGRDLWSRPVPQPTKGRQPFFALIASGRLADGRRWLAARGRGGGLALWLRVADGSP